MKAPEPRKGMPDPHLSEPEFRARFLEQFRDPAFRPLAGELEKIAAELDRYVGYWKPYATSHDELDADEAFQEEVRNAARSLLHAVRAKRAGRWAPADQSLKQPRNK